MQEFNVIQLGVSFDSQTRDFIESEQAGLSPKLRLQLLLKEEEDELHHEAPGASALQDLGINCNVGPNALKK